MDSPLPKLITSLKEKFEKFWRTKMHRNKSQLDKKLVISLSDKKFPSWKQFKKLPRILSQSEKFIIGILAAIIFIGLITLAYFNIWQKAQTVAENGGEYTEGLIGAPLYINPILAQTNDVDMDLSRLIFSGLLKYDKDFNLVPDLAEKYEISEDQKTYTFTLKQDVKWHDGESFSAADVVATFMSIQDEQYKSPLHRTFTSVTVEKIDDFTVKFTLVEPYAGFLNILTLGILPKHLWFDIPSANAKLAIYNQKPVGTGPYKFKSLLKEKNGVIKSYTLEKNKDYNGSEPFLERLTFKFYPDDQTAFDALNNKNIEGIGFLPESFIEKLQYKTSVSTKMLSLAQYSGIYFNQNKSEFLSAKYIREALSYAINRPKMIADVLNNQAQAIYSPILPGFLGNYPDIKKYEYQPKESAKILLANGWALTGDYLKKKDKELTIKLTTVEQEEYIKIANIIKEDWNTIGVNVELEIVPKENIQKDIINPRNYEALLYGEIIGYDVDPFAFWHSSQREAPGVNLANYANRKVDQLLEDARKITDPKIRSEKYIEFQKYLAEDLPAIFLYNPTYAYPIAKKIKGFQLTKIVLPSDRFINIEDWYVKTKKEFLK